MYKLKATIQSVKAVVNNLTVAFLTKYNIKFHTREVTIRL